MSFHDELAPSPYRPPQSETEKRQEEIDRQTLWRGLLCGAITFAPLQIACWELIDFFRRALSLPDFSNGLGFAIRIGIPSLVNIIGSMAITILLGGIVCFTAKTRLGVFYGWALIACINGLLQFVLQWSGLSFEKSSEIVAIALGATVVPVFTALLICYWLVGMQSQRRQFTVPVVAWIAMVLWLVF